MHRPFLKAEWRKLLMANYVINPNRLATFLPNNTELDLWNGKCYISLVGFMFLNTRLLGLKIPFHTDFEEINLRFYVRNPSGNTWKRGVVFIKEIVPKPALTLVANTLYKEHYETMPMKHVWEVSQGRLGVEYLWEKGNKWNSIGVIAHQTPEEIAVGSVEEFITEHYWGYTKIDPTKTSEYQVIHPRWNQYKVEAFSIKVDFAGTYGVPFGDLASIEPESVLLAEGSEIEVMQGKII